MGSLETSDLQSIEDKSEVLLFGSYIHLKEAHVAQKKANMFFMSLYFGDVSTYCMQDAMLSHVTFMPHDLHIRQVLSPLYRDALNFK